MKTARRGNARTLPRTCQSTYSHGAITLGDAIAGLDDRTLAAIDQIVRSLPPHISLQTCIVPAGIRIRARSDAAAALDRPGASLLVIPIQAGEPIIVRVGFETIHARRQP
jgi:hypothetical protein